MLVPHTPRLVSTELTIINAVMAPGGAKFFFLWKRSTLKLNG